MKLKLPKWIWFALVLVLVLLAAGILFFAVKKTTYQATSELMIVQRDLSELLSDGIVIDFLGGNPYDTIPITSCNLLTSERIIQSAADTLNLDHATLQDYHVYCAHVPDSNTILLEVVGSDPVVATELNQAIGYTAIAFIDSSWYSIFQLAWVEPPSDDNHSLNIDIELSKAKLKQFGRKAIQPFIKLWDDLRSFLGL